MKPRYFSSPAEWRQWLLEHHAGTPELLVGFYKVGSGRPSITWPESVDQALCFGWIDGIRRSIDDQRYCIRFTPRRPTSVWSAVNIRRVKELTRAGLMHVAGVKAVKARKESKSRIYAYEQQRKLAKLGPEYSAAFKANPGAWAFFQSRPPGYRRMMSWWVVSAKKEETRLRRLKALISDSAKGLIIQPLGGKQPAKS
jgi:uncharacterized protein YdeI (YjbR/CyaY-like superfamily)